MISARQQQILDYIHNYTLRHYLSPTLQEIADAQGIAHRGNISRHLNALVDKGLLVKTAGHRGFALASPPEQPALSLPFVGQIAAGKPIEAIEGQDRLDLYDLLMGEDHYVLKVRGDSMIECGILDGDLVVIEHSDVAIHGEIVVALIDDHEATLKRLYYRHDGAIILKAEHPSLPEQIYPADRVRIQGRLIAQLRSYRQAAR